VKKLVEERKRKMTGQEREESAARNASVVPEKERNQR